MNIGYQHIYFVGIGGIGMSALAHYLHTKNIHVSGCDSSLQQKSISHLQALGISIADESNVALHLEKCRPDLVVFTNTVPPSHPARNHISDKSISHLTRAELLGLITNGLTTIGITGSHGKTSTTAMTSAIFMHAAYDPTIFVGGFMHAIGSNLRIGTSSYAIVEADEAYRSFLTMFPDTSIITNISYEHMETYKSWDDIYATFIQYANQTKRSIIGHYDNLHLRVCSKNIKTPFITYGDDHGYDFSADKILHSTEGTSFIIREQGKETAHIFLKIPGHHMVYNALAAYAAGRLYGISPNIAAQALCLHQGVERRFEKKGYFGPCPVIDDYGHHPNEIDNLLKTARTICKGKLIVFFQPHKYSRTHALWHDFVRVLSAHNIDKLIITDIFTAHEEPIAGCNAERLAKEVAHNNALCTFIPLDENFLSLFNEAKSLQSSLTEEDMIITLGAGKLNNFATLLCQQSFPLSASSLQNNLIV